MYINELNGCGDDMGVVMNIHDMGVVMNIHFVTKSLDWQSGNL